MKQILYIDDEPAMLRVIEDVLKLKGYRLHTTSDPEEGLRLLRGEAIDLVLLDVKMPGKSGFDIYDEVRRVKKVPVLFVTAHPGAFTTESEQLRELWQRHVADGTTDIIYKPFQITLLCEKVVHLIGPAGDGAPAAS